MLEAAGLSVLAPILVLSGKSTISGWIFISLWGILKRFAAGGELFRTMLTILFWLWFWPLSILYLLLSSILEIVPSDWVRGTFLESFHSILNSDSGIPANKRGNETSTLEWIFWCCTFGVFTRFEARYCFEVHVPDRGSFRFGKMDKAALDEASRLLRVAVAGKHFAKVIGLIGILLLIGAPVLIMSCAVLLSLVAIGAPSRKPLVKFHNTADMSSGQRQGVYDIYRVTGGFESFIGIGYMDGRGSFCTNIHVTQKSDLVIGGVSYPCHTSFDQADQVSYVRKPAYAPISENDNLIVAASSPHVDTSEKKVVYVNTVATVFDEAEGVVIFPSVVMDNGVSGSPVFKEQLVQSGNGEYKRVLLFVGCISSSTERAKVAFEGKYHWQAGILKTINGFSNETVVRVTPGSHTQVFGKPGCGKSTFVIPHVLETGFTFCSRIFVSGPTRVIARQAFKSIKETFSDTDTRISLSIKGGRHDHRADVICVAHATLLKWIINGGRGIGVTTGFIIDETHFNDSRTKMLVYYLRYLKLTPRTEKVGFVVEMTATGHHIDDNCIKMSNGSNHDITDVPHYADDADKLVKYIHKVARSAPHKRILVFLPQVKGKDGVNGIYQLLIPKMKEDFLQPVIRLYRSCYEEAIPEIMDAAKKNDPAVILTTSLSECGANFAVDIVIDTCTQLRFQQDPNIPNGASIKAVNSYISESQKIQRRGRVGRIRPGEYHYNAKIDVEPGMYNDLDAENHDRDIFVNSMAQNGDFEHGFVRWENEKQIDQSLVLSQSQLQLWIDSDRTQEIRSSRLIQLLYSHDGVRFTDAELGNRVFTYFLFRPDDDKSSGFAVRVGGRWVHVRFWDDRDSDILKRIVKIYTPVGKRFQEEIPEDDPRYHAIQQLPARISIRKAHYAMSDAYAVGGMIYRCIRFPSAPEGGDFLQNFHHPSDKD